MIDLSVESFPTKADLITFVKSETDVQMSSSLDRATLEVKARELMGYTQEEIDDLEETEDILDEEEIVAEAEKLAKSKIRQAMVEEEANAIVQKRVKARRNRRIAEIKRTNNKNMAAQVASIPRRRVIITNIDGMKMIPHAVNGYWTGLEAGRELDVRENVLETLAKKVRVVRGFDGKVTSRIPIYNIQYITTRTDVNDTPEQRRIALQKELDSLNIE